MTDARRMWQLIEPVHCVTYFDPIAREPIRALGFEGFWAPYVIQRAAPLGVVGPAVVTAAFFGFHPRRAAAVLPEAWGRVPPAVALGARADGAVAALERHLDSGTADELADLLWPAAQAADCAGRVLGAANQALPRPDDSLASVWQATTTLREHRGDGHIAVLVSQDLSPLQAMQLKVAAQESVGENLRLGRAWSDADWEVAAEELRALGWVDGQGLITDAGATVRSRVEALTDAAAEQPWSVLTESEVNRLERLLEPVAQSVWSAGHMPVVNPIGTKR